MQQIMLHKKVGSKMLVSMLYVLTHFVEEVVMVSL